MNCPITRCFLQTNRKLIKYNALTKVLAYRITANTGRPIYEDLDQRLFILVTFFTFLTSYFAYWWFLQLLYAEAKKKKKKKKKKERKKNWKGIRQCSGKRMLIGWFKDSFYYFTMKVQVAIPHQNRPAKTVLMRVTHVCMFSFRNLLELVLKFILHRARVRFVFNLYSLFDVWRETWYVQT